MTNSVSFRFYMVFAVMISVSSGCKNRAVDEVILLDDSNHQEEWIKVSSGTFVFGSKEDAPYRAADAEEQVKVTLTRDFVMAQTEVTQHQWQQAGLELPPQFVYSPNLPVVFINFYEAAAYCNALSREEGFDECYDLSSCVGEFAGGGNLETPERSNVRCIEDPICEDEPDMYYCTEEIHNYDNWYECPGYRLPTTAEWEYAARAGTTTHTYNGDLLHTVNSRCIEQPNLIDIAWYCYNANEQLHPVGKKKANPWGFYDILGNTMEWTDYWGDGESLDYMDGHPGEDLTDPIGRITGHRKDIRGGGWTRLGVYTRSGKQSSDDETARRDDTGFRPVRTLFDK